MPSNRPAMLSGCTLVKNRVWHAIVVSFTSPSGRFELDFLLTCPDCNSGISTCPVMATDSWAQAVDQQEAAAAESVNA